MRIATGVLVSFLLVVPCASAQLNGSWVGTYTAISTSCRPPVPSGGSTSITLNQSGSNISGTLSVEVFVSDCDTASKFATAPSATLTSPFTGTVNGTVFTATFPTGPTDIGTVNGTMAADGNRLTIAFTAGDTHATALLSRSELPPADFSGTWSGHYSGVATFCVPSVAMTGAVTAELVQSGTTLSGIVEVQQPFSDCHPNSKTATATIQGTVTAESFKASFDAGSTEGWPVGNLRGTLDGDILIVSFVSGDTTGTATLSKPAPRARAVRH